jgi:hypothetical protein
VGLLNVVRAMSWCSLPAYGQEKENLIMGTTLARMVGVILMEDIGSNTTACSIESGPPMSVSEQERPTVAGNPDSELRSVPLLPAILIPNSGASHFAGHPDCELRSVPFFQMRFLVT